MFILAWEQAEKPHATKKAMQVACETSVLPATTAAPGSGDRNVPGGMIKVSGLRQPSFSGISSPTKHRNTYSTAARVTAGGELKLPSCCGPVPVKSTVALRFSRSTLIETHRSRPLSIL